MGEGQTPGSFIQGREKTSVIFAEDQAKLRHVTFISRQFAAPLPLLLPRAAALTHASADWCCDAAAAPALPASYLMRSSNSRLLTGTAALQEHLYSRRDPAPTSSDASSPWRGGTDTPVGGGGVGGGGGTDLSDRTCTCSFQRRTCADSFPTISREWGDDGEHPGEK